MTHDKVGCLSKSDFNDDEVVYRFYLRALPLLRQADQDRLDRIKRQGEGTVTGSSTTQHAEGRQPDEDSP
jgi:hypothetical protein